MMIHSCAVYTACFRVKQLDCFSACNYKIGDSAYYRLKPEDRVITLGSNMRYDKPAVLHTYLHRKGLLLADRHGGPDKKEMEKNSSAAASTWSAGIGTVANGTANDANQVIFFVKFLCAFIIFGRF